MFEMIECSGLGFVGLVDICIVWYFWICVRKMLKVRKDFSYVNDIINENI